MDSVGTIYVADGDGSIRKLLNGMVTTFVPRNTFTTVIQITVDLYDNLIVADYQYNTFGCVFKVDKNTAAVTTIPTMCGQVFLPYGVVARPDGSFIVMSSLGTFYQLYPNGQSSIFAGGSYGFVDGIGTNAKFGFTTGMTADGQGNIYVEDSACQCIRKISPNANVVTITPQNFIPQYPFSSILSDTYGNLYYFYNSQIVAFPYNANASFILTGSIYQGYMDGNSSVALFNFPKSFMMITPEKMLVADTMNRRLRIVLLQPPIPATTGVPTTATATTKVPTTAIATTAIATTGAANQIPTTSMTKATNPGVPTVPSSAVASIPVPVTQKPISSSLKMYLGLESILLIMMVLLFLTKQ